MDDEVGVNINHFGRIIESTALSAIIAINSPSALHASSAYAAVTVVVMAEKYF